MSYKITITNNETGEILVNNENAVAIIGAIADKEETENIWLTCCNAIEFASAVHGAESVVSQIKKESPELEILMKIKELMEAKK